MCSLTQFFIAQRRKMQPYSRMGFTLIEIVLAAGILSSFMVTIALYYKKILDVSEDTTRYIQSGFLLEEGVEAVKLIRDEGWSSGIVPLSTTTTYYLFWTGTRWTSTTTPTIVESVFTRTFTVGDVYRDATDNIVADPALGTFGTSSKKITFSVAWQSKGGRATTTKSAETYIMNLFNN
jgi:type II secretory pathway pseudopilin PulG